ncbi:MAG: cytochrome c [Candidatus Obscuribacter sp.]|nr:cytochrome c [Candidatus Obscuribacter sp.]
MKNRQVTSLTNTASGSGSDRTLVRKTQVKTALAAITIAALAQINAAAAPTAAPNKSDSDKFAVVKVKPYKGDSSTSGKKAEAIAAGKALFAANNCSNCHSVADKGGCLAPPLDGIGAYRGRPYVIARITLGDKFTTEFARRYKDEELMPHPRLPLAQSQKIADFLMSLPAPSGGYQVYGHAREESSEEKLSNPTPQDSTKLPSDLALAENGRKRFLSGGCLACHAVGSLGGRLAPNLAGIGSRSSIDYIEGRITRAELKALGFDNVKEGSSSGADAPTNHISMPASKLTPEDIHAISVFLSSLKK